MNKRKLFLACLVSTLHVLNVSAGLGSLIDDALGVASNAVDTAADVTTGAIDTVREGVRGRHYPDRAEVVVEHHYLPGEGEEVVRTEIIHGEGPDHVTVEKTVTTETYLD